MNLGLMCLESTLQCGVVYKNLPEFGFGWVISVRLSAFMACIDHKLAHLLSSFGQQNVWMV